MSRCSAVGVCNCVVQMVGGADGLGTIAGDGSSQNPYRIYISKTVVRQVVGEQFVNPLKWNAGTQTYTFAVSSAAGNTLIVNSDGLYSTPGATKISTDPNNGIKLGSDGGIWSSAPARGLINRSPIGTTQQITTAFVQLLTWAVPASVFTTGHHYKIAADHWVSTGVNVNLTAATEIRWTYNSTTTTATGVQVDLNYGSGQITSTGIHIMLEQQFDVVGTLTGPVSFALFGKTNTSAADAWLPQFLLYDEGSYPIASNPARYKFP